MERHSGETTCFDAMHSVLMRDYQQVQIRCEKLKTGPGTRSDVSVGFRKEWLAEQVLGLQGWGIFAWGQFRRG